MTEIPWTHSINFASALLLHSCITVLLKEALNGFEIIRRLSIRLWGVGKDEEHLAPNDQIRTSVVLDGYTSIFSGDQDGELAELYFTNTGFALLAVSLASSVAMNMLLSNLLLNTIVASTFGVTFLASLFNNGTDATLPIMALRRAGRFIWSDTPFVNFFSLIYIATVLHGQSMLRLQDYVTFRSIAVLELIFMKGKIAASSPEKQIDLMKRLIASEWIVVGARNADHEYLIKPFPIVERDNMVPFTTRQRLSVMFMKTSIGFQFGCLQGCLGPASCPAPEVGCAMEETSLGWTVYRFADDVMVIADCFAQTSPKTRWGRFLAAAHGVLLRRLGKVRVIYFLRTQSSEGKESSSLWHSNINLVTGVSKEWLDDNFSFTQPRQTCVIAGDEAAWA